MRNQSLAGRGSDLGALHQFVDGATAAGGALLLVGAAGIGKSALMDAAGRYGAARGARILRSEAGSPSGPVARPAIDRVLALLRAELDGLAETARDELADGLVANSLLVANATLELLRHAGRRRPLLLLIEDAHRLDRISAQVLGFAGRRLSGSRVGMMFALRSSAANGLLGQTGFREQSVEPLDADAAALLLRARYPVMGPRVRDRILAESGGNPLAILGMAAALSEPERTGADALPAVLPLGDRLVEATLSTVQGLPPATREILLAAALLDRPDLAVLDAAMPGRDARAVLAPAERRGLVSVEGAGGRLTFVQPLLRPALGEQAGSAGRRRVHRVLAAALADRPAQQVHHLAAAAVGPDADLADRLVDRSHTHFRLGEVGGAVAALLRAAELSPDPRDRSRRLLEAALLRADASGDLTVLARLLVRAEGPAAAVAAAYIRLAEHGDEALSSMADAVIAYAAGAEANDEVLSAALLAMIFRCWSTADAGSWAHFDRALAGVRSPAPRLVELCALAFGDPLRLTGEQLDEITASAEKLGLESNPITTIHTALAAVHTDRVAPCQAALARAFQGGREGGETAVLALRAAFVACPELWHSGQWPELTALVTDALTLCAKYGLSRYEHHFTYFRSLVRAATGESETDDSAALGAAGVDFHQACQVRALTAIGRGDFAAAHRELGGVSPVGSLPPYRPGVLRVLFDVVESAARSGRTADARAHVTAMTRAGVARLSPRLALLSAGCTALVTDPAGATEAYEAALATPDAQHWQFDLARIRLSYGEHLRRIGELATSRAQLTAAGEVFRRLGARPWTRRTEGELRACGLNTASAGRNVVLTPQERRIAELVTIGLSNREIGDRLKMSHRTVEACLYRLYPRLGITSRAALRDALDR